MIPRRTHLRNIVVSTLAVALVLMMGLQQGIVPESVQAQQSNATLSVISSTSQSVNAGQSANFTLRLTNNTTSSPTINLAVQNPPSGFNTVFNPTPVTLTAGIGVSTTVSLAVTVPASQASGTISLIVSDPSNTNQIAIVLNVTGTTATNTNTPSPSMSPTPTGSISITPGTQSKSGDAGSFVTYTFAVVNNGTASVNVALSSLTSVTGVTVGFSATQLSVSPNGGSVSFDVVLSIDANATPGPRGTLQIKATDQSNSNNSATAFLQINITVNGATVTPTGTTTATVSPTPTVGPSLTATPPICQDSYEGDGDMGSAKEIQVNLPQPSTNVDPQVPGHTICPEGDEDWLFFGGLAGKVYTIDVSDMAAGLDLSLALYDANGKQLAFNDDYYNRAQGTPDARAPGAAATGDIRPRIQSWTAPANGRYYIQVRDAAGGGRRRGAYTIQLLSESYGPTPTQDTQLCQDLFEPDGLPEQARLVGPNEIQPLHTFCPTGDADWIKFFGAQGKTYFIFTDTRPYASNSPRPPNAPVNPGENGNVPEAGADSIIYLTDRDGVSLLDFNDDIPGGSTLDSQIEFTPSVDGFYFLQVKNRGDLGNQFIRYDLTVQLCLPGQTNCGRPNATPAPPTVPPSPAGETTQTPEFDLDQTATPTPTGTT